MEDFFSQKAKSYTNLSEVVTQPPRVEEVAASPPRVTTPTGSPPPNLNDTFTNRYTIIEDVPELRVIPSHPNEDDDDNEDNHVHPLAPLG